MNAPKAFQQYFGWPSGGGIIILSQTMDFELGLSSTNKRLQRIPLRILQRDAKVLHLIHRALKPQGRLTGPLSGNLPVSLFTQTLSLIPLPDKGAATKARGVGPRSGLPLWETVVLLLKPRAGIFKQASS